MYIIGLFVYVVYCFVGNPAQLFYALHKHCRTGCTLYLYSNMVVCTLDRGVNIVIVKQGIERVAPHIAHAPPSPFSAH